MSGVVSISISALFTFSNSTGCVFCTFFRSFFSAVLEVEATGVSVLTLEVLTSGFSPKIVVLVSVLLLVVKLSNSDMAVSMFWVSGGRLCISLVWASTIPLILERCGCSGCSSGFPA